MLLLNDVRDGYKRSLFVKLYTAKNLLFSIIFLIFV